jgi:hypothetical protein
MSFGIINFDELHEDLMEHQENVALKYLDESIKTDLDGLGADSMKRSGSLITLKFKSGDAKEIAAKVKSAMKAHSDKIKHIGAHDKDGGVVAEIEMSK